MGQSYLLACPEGGELLLQEAVQRVDTAMCHIRDAGKVKARERIAVLASLNLAFELSRKETQEPVKPAAVATAEPTLSAGANMDTSTQDRLEDLIRRLDQSLGNDGRLI